VSEEEYRGGGGLWVKEEGCMGRSLMGKDKGSCTQREPGRIGSGEGEGEGEGAG